MSNTNATTAPPEPETAPPAPSQDAPALQAPEPAPNAPERPRKTRTNGIPAGPVGLATANTATLAGSGVYTAFGTPGLAAAAAVGGAVVAAAVTSSPGRQRNAARRRKEAARQLRQHSPQNRGGKWSPTKGSGAGRGGGGAGRSGGGGKGSSATRPGSSLRSGGLGSTPTRKPKSGPTGSGGVKPQRRPGGSGSGIGPTKGPGKHRSGSKHHKPGSGSKHPGSGSAGPGSGRRSGSGGSGGSPRSRRLDRKQNGSGRTRTPNLLSKPGQPSKLRSVIGPRPATGPRSRRGGLINRGDGSRRQPIQSVRNGARRIGNAARAVKHAAQVTGRGAQKAYNSKAGKAMRKWTVGAAKRTWGVGMPATAALGSFLGQLTKGAGLKAAWQAARRVWQKHRARIKNKRAAKNNPGIPGSPGVPGTVVNRPTTKVDPGPAAPAAAPTGGGISMAQAQFNQAAAEMLGAASVYQPEGMMEVGRDFVHMGTAFRQIAQAMGVMARRANDEDPLHPAILDQLKEMHQMLMQVAEKADELAPAFRSYHAVDIKRISEPRNGEQKWDYSANRDHVGTTI